MRLKFYLLAALLISSLPLAAQYKTVMFNYERAYFNDGQPLPAESKFIITGDVPPNIDMVVVKVYSSSDTDDDPIYQNGWTRQPMIRRGSFTVPVNQPLRGNNEYTFLLNYYSKASIRQQQQLLQQLDAALWAYIDQSYEVNRSSIDLRKHPKTMRSDMNAIVNQGLTLYRNQLNTDFRGFSDIVLEKLDQIEELRLNKARFNVFSKEEENTKTLRLRYAQEQLEALKTMVSQEVVQYIGRQLYVLTDIKKITDYGTEKTKNVIAINAGYGGVYYSGDIDNYSSDTAPYVGVSFPLGKAPFSAPFWERTSISTGVFLQNFEFGENTVSTGPLVQRPIFLALGYRALPFVRLNAGATLLQNDQGGNSISDLNFDRMYVRPFVGLSIEVNLWLNLNR